MTDDLITTSSDGDLVDRARTGDSAAYGELWSRHYRAGITVARSITSLVDPDDLVQESFTRIFQTIQNGGGPQGAFRAYLFTSIRNAAASWGRGPTETPIEDLDVIVDPLSTEREAEAALDKGLTHTAFRSLPTRWQEVLWYTEIEQMKPSQVAPLLGMKASAVAQLAVRAREGLREAWITAHLKSLDDGSDCQWTTDRLATYSRSTISNRDKIKVEEHLTDCSRCAIVAHEADEVASHLALVFLPLTLGATGAAAYLATLQGGGETLVALAGGTAPAMPLTVVSDPATMLSIVGGASSATSVAGGVGPAAQSGGAAGASSGGVAGIASILTAAAVTVFVAGAVVVSAVASNSHETSTPDAVSMISTSDPGSSMPPIVIDTSTPAPSSLIPSPSVSLDPSPAPPPAQDDPGFDELLGTDQAVTQPSPPRAATPEQSRQPILVPPLTNPSAPPSTQAPTPAPTTGPATPPTATTAPTDPPTVTTAPTPTTTAVPTPTPTPTPTFTTAPTPTPTPTPPLVVDDAPLAVTSWTVGALGWLRVDLSAEIGRTVAISVDGRTGIPQLVLTGSTSFLMRDTTRLNESPIYFYYDDGDREQTPTRTGAEWNALLNPG